MPPEIYRVVPERPIFNALIYGDMNAGKTYLAASCQDHPEMRNVLFLNVEGGLLTVAHRGDIHAVDVHTTEELEEIFWELSDPESKKYRTVNTVVIDSGNEVQTRNLEEIVAAAIEAGKNKKDRSGAARTTDDIFQEDYGKSTAQLKRIFRYFKEMPRNLIVTAHAKFVYPPSTRGVPQDSVEPLAVLPMFTEKLGKAIMGYMDFVWYMEHDSETDERRILTRSTGVYRAKTRGPRFLEAIGPVITLNDSAKKGPRLMMPEIYDMYVAAATGQPVRLPKRSKTKN